MKTFSNFYFFVLNVLLALFLVACGGAEEAPAQASAPVQNQQGSNQPVVQQSYTPKEGEVVIDESWLLFVTEDKTTWIVLKMGHAPEGTIKVIVFDSVYRNYCKNGTFQGQKEGNYNPIQAYDPVNSQQVTGFSKVNLKSGLGDFEYNHKPEYNNAYLKLGTCN